MPDDLDHLIDRLHKLPLDLDAHDIADALWLSTMTGVGAARAPALPQAPAEPATSPPEKPTGSHARTMDSTPAPPAAPSKPDHLYDGASTGRGGQRARQARIRRPRGLPMPLDLARSMRAFGRKWRAGRRWQLDLDASVAGYARTGQLTPIFRAAPERWFEVTVLVDDSPSMALWRDTVTEFTSLLRQLGAFRSVRTLTLTLDGESPEVRNAAGQLTHPGQLRSSTGRRLVLVLSDCLAEAWSGRKVWQTLWDWARSTPTALVNPLPSSLWRRTGLDLPAVRVASGAVGGANTTLRYQPPWFTRSRERWLPLPTPALTAQSMGRWANTLMRADPVGTDAVLVPPSGRVSTAAAEEPSTVETFRHVASEAAFRLAVFSSPHDPVSLQMLELLRDQLVPDATASDMAEIIASGVVTAERDDGHTVLRFRPDLRPQLQRLLLAPDAWRVHEILTDYVATHAGTPGDLVLAVPDPAGTVTLPAHLQPFAEASRSTLRLLGIVPQTPASTDSGLAALLAQAPLDELLMGYRALAPQARTPGNSSTDVVRALERLEAPAGALPKPVEFAERLAHRMPRPLADVLRRWSDTQAQARDMTPALQRLRADIAKPLPPRLETGSVSSGGGTLWPLVKALALLPSMASLQDRNFIVRLLADRLGTTLQIEETPRTLSHILSIVEVAVRRPDGLRALLDVVHELDDGTAHLRQVERIIAEHTALPLWPEEEREELFSLLRGVIFPDLVELYRQVAGAGAPELPAETSYREVFLTLETLSADPDGLPKSIVFVERLASGRRSELSIELRRWSDRQARRLGVNTELQKMRRTMGAAARPAPPPNLPAYLVILIRREGLAGDRFQLSHWHQLDLSEGWHPERGEDFFGALNEVKRHVAVLIEATEARWARYQPDIRIEFVLPGELLNLDVDQWPWEVEGPLPSLPLGCRYTVAVRSLERMQSGKWHRSWHSRWALLTGQLKDLGGITPECVRWIASGDVIRGLIADLETDPDVVAMTLSKPPDPDMDGGTEVTVGLRAGLPVIVWSREDCDSEEFMAAVRELLHADGPGDILQRMRQIRTTAYKSQSGHVGHHLALLWDDPERLVVPGDH